MFKADRLGEKEECFVDLLGLNIYKLFSNSPDYTLYTCFR